MKAVTHAFALGLYRWVPTEGSCNGFFAFYATARVSVTHTAGARDTGLLWESVRESQGRRR